jgi:hypothetical protein
MDAKMNSKAQISIFIIIAILLVVGIGLILILREVKPSIPGLGGEEINPNIFLESCLDNKVRESIKLISEQGGYAKPTFYKNFSFIDENFFRNISYLCYNFNNYKPCINHEPLLISHLEDEIHNETAETVEECFFSLVDSLKEEKYKVYSEYHGFKVELGEGKVIIDIEAKVVFNKSKETERKENFRIIYPSKFYDIAIVVQEIISQEAKYCNFDISGYTYLHPEFKIEKIATSDLEIIYKVEHRNTKERFFFAVRSCVIPPGI